MIDKIMKSKNVEKAIQSMFLDDKVKVKSVTKNKNRGVYKIIATDDNVLGLISVKDLVSKFEDLLKSQNVAECVLTKIGGVGCSSFITSKALPLVYTEASLEKYIKDYFFCFISELHYQDTIILNNEEYFIYYDYYLKADSEMAGLIYVEEDE